MSRLFCLISDFGNRQVNSSIGAQWRNRLASIKKAAESSPKLGTNSIYMNVRLHKC
ncbi:MULTISPECIES: polymorphic toxin type 15 domain-containing protein [Pseudomonas]|uniref:polymorphic toxin type 15 domain-containing protein n=1 Tax=Pseudomonas TaxID=286 RepID=UPI0009EE51B5|nr:MULTISPECIES: polymorphic toxin type 15 domain-containing protein [Pseudomonas]WPX89473.1 hypothetical protein PsasTeo6_29704 [Pseudomonas asiatica]